MQNTIRQSTNRLTDTINGFIAEMELRQDRLHPIMQKLKFLSNFIWKIALFTSICVLSISLVLSIGLLLGIIHAERAAKVTFVIGAILITLGSCGLSIFTIIVLLAGSHGEVFLCRPLYDTANFQVFSKLFDKPGWIYENETINGVINDLLFTTNVDETKLLNISLATAVQKCEQNEASFQVFQFDRLANTTQILEIHEYTKLEEEIDVSALCTFQCCEREIK